MITTDQTIGTRIAYRRQRLGLQQKELAALVGIPPRYLNDIETGRKVPRVNVIARLAVGLGVSIEELFNDK